MKMLAAKKNKKIIFDENGEVTTKLHSANVVTAHKDENADDDEQEEQEDFFSKSAQKRVQSKEDDANQKWYHVYAAYNSHAEPLDMKETERLELHNLCEKAYEAQKPAYNKRNPNDARWLQTAIHKGTAKDRAYAGALLITSNPLGNLEALSTLVSFTRISNKSSSEVLPTVTDLWKQVLLPADRALISLAMRGHDYKLLRKNSELTEDVCKRIYAYWYFEQELKEQYFEFLKNVQQGMQTGQEHNKNASIVSAAQLLMYAPEKEQLLLTMLVNKLGDPVAKVAAKSLHHLSEVAHKHPNMSVVIVKEIEKLLFRNNISERAQHFALCYMANLACAGSADSCTKIVHICFALFKILVQKGAVNNRTMQAILRCLQKAIVQAKPAAGSTEILSKDMQDTIYRLVHLADIHISVQTLGLLLQLATVKTEKSDRFYNALYKKLLDLNITNIGVKTAAQLLHIVHRAIHIDGHVARAQAFIKRLLQLAAYLPAHIAAGVLIVIHKLLRTRKELLQLNGEQQQKPINAVDLDRFDSDGEEKYEDIAAEATEVASAAATTAAASSWHHAKVTQNVAATAGDELKVRELICSKYDAYHRVPAFAGAELSMRAELLLLREHVHPTVQVFADCILFNKRIDYYGDPLKDFGLPHFLERFAFKNPKKLNAPKAEIASIAHKRYISFGARGQPVKSLTKSNCTEDEKFIFQFLQQKRKQAELIKDKAVNTKDEGEEEHEEHAKFNDVDDDEFDEYLDNFFGSKSKHKAAANDDLEQQELDFLNELGGEMKTNKKRESKKQQNKNAEQADSDDDWADASMEQADNSDIDEFEAVAGSGDEDDEDEMGSIELNDAADEQDDQDDEEAALMSLSDMEDDDDDDDEDDEDEENLSSSDDEAKPNKRARHANAAFNEKSFAKQLKHSTDMSSLFAAADDFAELLEETGKTKGQGTTNAVFNKDKSSDKQLKWEEQRHSNKKNYSKKFNGKSKAKAAGKHSKRRH